MQRRIEHGDGGHLAGEAATDADRDPAAHAVADDGRLHQLFGGGDRHHLDGPFIRVVGRAAVAVTVAAEIERDHAM